jgi:hypothetical protein
VQAAGRSTVDRTFGVQSKYAWLVGHVSSADFGSVQGQPVECWTLGDGSIEVSVLTYGALIQSLMVPDRHAELADVVLGF